MERRDFFAGALGLVGASQLTCLFLHRFLDINRRTRRVDALPACNARANIQHAF
jgi:hypothetical protein